MKATIPGKQLVRKASVLIALFGPALVLFYAVAGHRVIRAAYESDLPLVRGLMSGKAVTPLAAYYWAGDDLVPKLAIGLLVVGVLSWLFFRNPLGLVMSAVSTLIVTFSVFLTLRLFPSLIKPLHFDVIPYFAFDVTHIPDATLGFRERPFNRSEGEFVEYGYSPVFGIDVPSVKLTWETDGEGFRNRRNIADADIAVISSSFGEYGPDFEDTFPRQLEKKLAGPGVVNLSKGGYGPFQYLEVFRRYAVPKHVRYALIVFYAPNDIENKLGYWLRTGDSLPVQMSVETPGLLNVYKTVLQQTTTLLSERVLKTFESMFREFGIADSPHPDVAILRLPNGTTRRIVFFDKHLANSTDDLLRTPAWEAWQKILLALKQMCDEHSVVPVIVYVPVATEIYAEYSTSESGVNWLSIRDAEIATKTSNEEAARRVAANLGIQIISIRPAYERAAREGELLYYPLDSHWSEQGREIAASVVADAIKALDNENRNNVQMASTPLRQARYFGSEYGFIERTIDGRIKSWDHRAEELYGWKQNEAIGKVTHTLLKTQFPEPLEKINEEILQNGRWEGKLVHATRDGRRVEVDSNWIWDPSARQGDIIEINRPTL